MGQVNRVLSAVRVEGSGLPVSDEIQLDGKPVGALTSAVVSPRECDVRGFSLLRREATSPGAVLTLDGRSVRILD